MSDPPNENEPESPPYPGCVCEPDITPDSNKGKCLFHFDLSKVELEDGHAF